MKRYERPILLETNKIAYLIPGGKLINRFLGEPETETLYSQMWVASVVQSALKGAEDSRSFFIEDGRKIFLGEELYRKPELYLGQDFYERFGVTTGFLLKLLNSRDRLLVQTHPDNEKAGKYFGLPFGKTESWYVLATEPDKAAYIWAGFCPGVTREYFLKLVKNQDTKSILKCLNQFRIKKGDTIFIPAGTPHALGAHSLVAELQEPVDITLRAERFRPDGSELPEESMHLGIGYEGLLDCFDFQCYDQDVMRKRIFLKTEIRSTPWGREETVIDRKTVKKFGMRRLWCAGTTNELENDPFTVTLILNGGGWIETWRKGSQSICRIPIQKGQELFLPNGMKKYRYIPDGIMEVLECEPPIYPGKA